MFDPKKPNEERTTEIELEVPQGTEAEIEIEADEEKGAEF